MPDNPSSHEAVAFELMKFIGGKELGDANNIEQMKREYWLTLFAECRRVVTGKKPDSKAK